MEEVLASRVRRVFWLRGKALEHFENCLDCPFEGLTVAARATQQSGHSTGKSGKAAERLDMCFNVLRHLTEQNAHKYAREFGITEAGCPRKSPTSSTESDWEQQGLGSLPKDPHAIAQDDIEDRLDDLKAMLYDIHADLKAATPQAVPEGGVAPVRWERAVNGPPPAGPSKQCVGAAQAVSVHIEFEEIPAVPSFDATAEKHETAKKAGLAETPERGDGGELQQQLAVSLPRNQRP
ncbi:unnamed protein product [Prorocentrum cordatum]|uniref:Uncharacterized protein n=1 Tax=Prorocentrum cordatum TaxID=2364126 RepID=A0ABN9RGF0_9DINO|nr:unnamed protein product [Polarella glacialis]